MQREILQTRFFTAIKRRINMTFGLGNKGTFKIWIKNLIWTLALFITTSTAFLISAAAANTVAESYSFANAGSLFLQDHSAGTRFFVRAGAPEYMSAYAGAYYVTVVDYPGGLYDFDPSYVANAQVRSELREILAGLDSTQIDHIDIDAYAHRLASASNRELAWKRTVDSKWLVIEEHPEFIPLIRQNIVSREFSDKNTTVIAIWLVDETTAADRAQAAARAEAAAKAEAARIAAEKARAEAERAAAEAEALRKAAEEAEALRIAAEEEAARMELERLAGESASRLAAEEAARRAADEAARRAAEEAARRAAQEAADKAAREAAEMAAVEAARRAAEEAAQKVEEIVEKYPATPGSSDLKIPAFALSTNLLYDAVTAVNFGIEVPLGHRWSLRADYMFPWWVWDQNSRAFQILHLDLSARVYLGERTLKRVMTGWYLSAGAGVGYYDFEPKDTGIQGEEIIGAIGGGYSVLLGKNWSLDLGIGFGPIATRYRHYQGRNNNTKLIYQYDGRWFYFGPTVAKVGLTYTFGFKSRKAAPELDQYGRYLDLEGEYFGKGADGAVVKAAKDNAREAKKAVKAAEKAAKAADKAAKKANKANAR